MKQLFFRCVVFSISILATISSCTKTSNGGIKASLVYVINEGNYGGNGGILMTYDPVSKQTADSVFFKANDQSYIGDTPTSLTFHNGKGYLTTNNKKVLVIDPETNKLVTTITGVTSPRYMAFYSDSKAYITDISESKIHILNPLTNEITGSITLEAGQYAEQIVLLDDYIYTNLWSGGTEILKIDPKTDEIVHLLEVGIQPKNIGIDINGKLWIMTDGGYPTSPTGYEEFISFVRINPNQGNNDDDGGGKMEIENIIKRNKVFGASNFKMAMPYRGDEIFYLNGDMFKFGIKETIPLEKPFVEFGAGINAYGLNIEPVTQTIYVTNAGDYAERGSVLRYCAPIGKSLGTFEAGVIPGGCFFKLNN